MKKSKIAIIIGRYQTYSLHEDQIKMINNVISKHTDTIIVLGNSLMRGTIENPLDLRARKAMIHEKFPKLHILYINDVPGNDELWSKNLDELIENSCGITSDTIPVLYGSKNTFYDKYKGKYEKCVFDCSAFISSSELRKKAFSEFNTNLDYRAGFIAAQNFKYPTAYQTVDVAILTESNNQVLLGRKKNETKFQFIGGFSDPTSTSLENDVRREAYEETGLEIDDIKYICSTIIDDERYKYEQDKIKTAFFTAKYIFGRPTPNDDIVEVKWFSLVELGTDDSLTFDRVVTKHHILLKTLLKHLNIV